MLDINNTVLLITGCISPESDIFSLSISDSKKRYEQYINTILWSIDHSKFNKIVFCDNSNHVVDDSLFDYANRKGKQFEWLAFQGNTEQTIIKGKGFGEGEIIQYAINHSYLLHCSNCFCKITGRLTVANIDSFLSLANDGGIYFWATCLNKKVFPRAIDTRFYCVPIKIYIQVFSNAFNNVDDKNGKWLEHCFYLAYSTYKLKSDPIFFYPDFRGISGSMGQEYKLSKFKLIEKSIVSRMGLYIP